MKEFVEKLIGRLEENTIQNKEVVKFFNEGGIKFVSASKAKEIVNQLAEEYNNGWIPCSERLPEESLNSVIGWDAHRERCCFVQYYNGRWVLGNDIESVKIVAWQPVPALYKQKGE